MVKQVVPPPRRAYVEKDVSVDDIVFARNMRATEPMAPNSEQLTTTRYQECHSLARRVQAYRNHVHHLKKRVRTSEDADNDCDEIFVFDDKTAAFVLLVDECSKDIDNASKFQKNWSSTSIQKRVLSIACLCSLYPNIVRQLMRE